MPMEPHIAAAVLDFIIEQMGIENDVGWQNQMRSVVNMLTPGRRSIGYTEIGDTYSIIAVTGELLIVKQVNVDAKIDHVRTRKLQEIVTLAIAEQNEKARVKTVLFCYDITKTDLRRLIEEVTVPRVQSSLGSGFSVTSESQGPLAVQAGEVAQMVAEREARNADVVILCLTSGYMSTPRFAQQASIFPVMLRGKIIPIVYESGLVLPPWLSMLESDDGIDLVKLPIAIRNIAG